MTVIQLFFSIDLKALNILKFTHCLLNFYFIFTMIRAKLSLQRYRVPYILLNKNKIHIWFKEKTLLI